MLLPYACIRRDELHFSRWRTFIFESPELQPAMKKAYLSGRKAYPVARRRRKSGVLITLNDVNPAGCFFAVKGDAEEFYLAVEVSFVVLAVMDLGISISSQEGLASHPGLSLCGTCRSVLLFNQ
jgi:hypothetical protein